MRVNARCPRWTLPDMARGGSENEHMGPAAVFLADPTQMCHTGDHLVVDGGYTVF